MAGGLKVGQQTGSWLREMQTFTQFIDTGMDLLRKQMFTSLGIVYICLQHGSKQLFANSGTTSAYCEDILNVLALQMVVLNLWKGLCG